MYRRAMAPEIVPATELVATSIAVKRLQFIMSCNVGLQVVLTLGG
jgi:hypothetical protein